MKLSSALLIPAIIGAATAASIDGNVYIIQGDDWTPTTSNPPSLTPEEARLVFAQRLGVSQYHGIGDAKEDTLSHINTFGGRQESIFQESGRDKAAELILFIQGVDSNTAEHYLNGWPSEKPAFTISNAPSAKSNFKLIEDLQQQVGPVHECAFKDAINSFSDRCWNGRSKAIFMDLLESKSVGIRNLVDAQDRLAEFAKNNDMNTMVVVIPEGKSARSSKGYGSYEMPSQISIRQRQAEEPMTELPETSAPAFQTKQVTTPNASEPITGVPAVCYSTLEDCNSFTNNCSGHGECYKKFGSTERSCFACQCVVQDDHFLAGEQKTPSYRQIRWGGAACQKKDVSGPFWLFAIFTVVLIGLVSWSVGLLFSIGEEKLPGVIGAGVSSSKAR